MWLALLLSTAHADDVVGMAVPKAYLEQAVCSSVAGIYTAELAYDAAYDTFIPAGPLPTKVAQADELLTTWPSPAAGFDTIGWKPSKGVTVGTYWVEVKLDQFGTAAPEVHGAARMIDGTWVHCVAGSTTQGKAQLSTSPPVTMTSTPFRCAPQLVTWTDSVTITFPSGKGDLKIAPPTGKAWWFKVDKDGWGLDITPPTPALVEKGSNLVVTPSADPRLFPAVGVYTLTYADHLDIDLEDRVGYGECKVRIK